MRLGLFLFRRPRPPALCAASPAPRAEFTATCRLRQTLHKGAPSKRMLYVGRDALRLDDANGAGFVLKERSTGTATRVDLKHATRRRGGWSGWPYEVAPGESPCGKGPGCVQLKPEVRRGRRVEKWKETNPSCLGCSTTFIWVDRALGFEVRREIVGIEVHELTNIRRGVSQGTRAPGTCQATSLSPGCLGEVEGGVVRPTICH